MTLVRIFGVLTFSFLASACQLGYLAKSGYGQLDLLRRRVSIEAALNDPQLATEKKSKIRLALQAKSFAETDLHLQETKNYSAFVKLDRPYVTYVVSAAPKWKLQHHQWDYPIVGSMPYKGFFNEKDAKIEKLALENENLDTYMRGVSAYSTLGWFDDPILSSMLQYDDYDLVNTIIHETVHATLYIKHAADFNERLATFLGNKGSEQFYRKKEGEKSITLAQIVAENEDQKIFSNFISQEINGLEKWYANSDLNSRSEIERQKRIDLIQENFLTKIRPILKTKSFDKFSKNKLNNARLLVFKTYMQDLEDFEELYQILKGNYREFLEACRSLENSKNPSLDLKKLIQSHQVTK